MNKIFKFIFLSFLAIGMVGCKKNNESSSSNSQNNEFLEEIKENNSKAEGVFLNGSRVDGVNETQIKNEDVKLVEKYNDGHKLTDYAWGYSVELPEGLAYDFTLDEVSVKASNSHFYFRVSKEYAFYSDFNFSLDDLFQYYDSESYLKENNMKDITSDFQINSPYKYRFKAVQRQLNSGFQNLDYTHQYYFYIYLYQEADSELPMYGIFIKTYYEDFLDDAIKVINSFRGYLTASDNPKNNVNYTPSIESYWSSATQELYRRIMNLDEVAWGLFSPRSDYNYRVVDNIEKAIDYKFPMMMTYRNVVNTAWGNNAQIAKEVCENIKKAWNERNQVTVLTLHMSMGNNVASKGKNYTFDILDGAYDTHMADWARAIKAMEIPVLIRFSNEMNTDWTTYSGTMLMSDPEAYKQLYTKLYDTFEKYEVDNALWIFNPYNRQYPIYNWNNQLAYYPGNDYVQFMGLTAYNGGTARDYGSWESFEELYKPLGEEYEKYYSNFGWVIGEFGCSSSKDQSKPAWISEMFDKMKTLVPRVKIAIWFNYADYLTGDFDSVCSTYFWLDETPECLEAFKQGIKETVTFTSLIENFDEFLPNS